MFTIWILLALLVVLVGGNLVADYERAGRPTIEEL